MVVFAAVVVAAVVADVRSSLLGKALTDKRLGAVYCCFVCCLLFRLLFIVSFVVTFVVYCCYCHPFSVVCLFVVCWLLLFVVGSMIVVLTVITTMKKGRCFLFCCCFNG